MGSVCHGYMCILLYVKLMQCSGFPEMLNCRGYVSLRCICILLYVKLIWCNGKLGEGWGQSAIGICAFCYI